ncbi:MAG: protein-methionine-sulfoxide reductase catalytic subunit MsrP [Thermoanaerobaculia bacterium]|nr:protein-methionine-sulfoxide reductase catalytic subunit MsrP [Thermoanaerobaculia bacterium]
MTAVHIPPSWKLPERLTTPEPVFANRRQILRTLGLGTLSLALPGWARAAATPDTTGSVNTATGPSVHPALGKLYADRFPAERNPAFTLGDRQLTPEIEAARYNNFYEFTTNKEKVWELAQGYAVAPWKIEVKGLVKQKRTLDLDDLFTRFPLEERLYRFRCVERWSMQVPWTGFPLRALIDFCEPLASAKFVRFQSVLDKERLPGQRTQGWYPWPYFEGLRLDEARNELAFVALGSYGHALPMQHGAPLRLAIPWKYGYKGPKSIVAIEFVTKQPSTFWNDLQAEEYGFYSNVDPGKPHPRWSQQWEKDIGTGETRESMLYNGYGEQVGALYTGKEV